MVIRDPVSQLPFTSGGGEGEKLLVSSCLPKTRRTIFFFFFFSPPPIVTPVFIPSTPFIAIPRNIQAWNLNKARRETERERTLSKRPGHPPVLFFLFPFLLACPDGFIPYLSARFASYTFRIRRYSSKASLDSLTKIVNATWSARASSGMRFRTHEKWINIGKQMDL